MPFRNPPVYPSEALVDEPVVRVDVETTVAVEVSVDVPTLVVVYVDVVVLTCDDVVE